MIYQLEGVVSVVYDQLVVLVVSGVGFKVYVSFSGAFIKGEKILLHTSLSWSQEQGPSLYGFKTELERTLFELLVRCSGIGPKMALSVLRDVSPQDIIEAAEQEDSQVFSKVSGIGAKKAEHLVIFLKHKISSDLSTESGELPQSMSVWKDVSLALKSLGYKNLEIQRARLYLQKDGDAKKTFDEALRAALSFLAKKI